MSENLSTILGRGINMTPIEHYSRNAVRQIPLLPPSNNVVNIEYNSPGTSLIGRNVASTAVWTIAPTALNASAVRFVGSIARIDDTTGWLLAASSAGTTFYLGKLNFGTGAITNTATLAANPNSSSALAAAADGAFYQGAGGAKLALNLKSNGNLILTIDQGTAFYEFTTAGASVTDSATNAANPILSNYLADDGSCWAQQFGNSSIDTTRYGIRAYDKYGRKLYNAYSVPVGSGFGYSVSGSNPIYKFGNYVAIPDSPVGAAAIFLKSDFEKILKRALIEVGGKLT